MACRKTLWTWEYKSVSLLTDLTIQYQIDGLNDPRLTTSSISRDEAMDILNGISEALPVSRYVFFKALAKAWGQRLKAKAKLFDWEVKNTPFQ